MKKRILWILWLFPFCLQAQLTEYNRKGDEAIRRKDYQDAKMWYEEGVSYCDSYSINQLTAIWMEEANIRPSMGPVMSKCLDCLNNMAISRKDTLAMKKLILFYSEGISTSKDENSANSWQEMLEQIRNPHNVPQFRTKKPREKMTFFVGLSSLPTVAPYGIRVGGAGAIGWYVRIHTNLAFARKTNVEMTMSNNGEKWVIPEFDENGSMYRFVTKSGSRAKTGKSMWTGTAGLMFRILPEVYLSAGAGYVQYDESCEYELIDEDGYPTERGWARNGETSGKGVAVDADAMVVFGKRFYGTVGCSVLNMKYVYPNIGIGVFINLK